MSRSLPHFFSRGFFEAGFYNSLRKQALMVAFLGGAVAVGYPPHEEHDAIGSFRQESSGHPVPDPFLKINDLRPSREFWGVWEDHPSAPKIAATAKPSAAAPKEAKAGNVKAATGKIAKAVNAAFRVAKLILVSDDEDEGYGDYDCAPRPTGGSLGGKKPEPT